jgi:monothiol glutaredoxin
MFDFGHCFAPVSLRSTGGWFRALWRLSMDLDEGTRKRIADIIASDRVVLFMKGDRHAPQCGFSATVIQILEELVPEYATVDVLSDPEIRNGIKEFSNWPTIPQLYVSGEFLGGCDIVREMYTNGELRDALTTG